MSLQSGQNFFFFGKVQVTDAGKKLYAFYVISSFIAAFTKSRHGVTF